MLLFPLCPPSRPGFCSEQAESGYLDVTGDGAAGGESVQDRGPWSKWPGGRQHTLLGDRHLCSDVTVVAEFVSEMTKPDTSK